MTEQEQKYLELIGELRIELTKAKHELDNLHQAFDIKTFVHNNLNRDYIKLREENKRLLEALEFYADCGGKTAIQALGLTI